MDDLEPIASIHSQILDLPPSCAQFCPAFPDYLVVGTYELQKDQGDDQGSSKEISAASKPQSRNGSLVVFKMTGDTLIKVQTLSQPSALLDLRFHRASTGHRDVLAAVSSTGTLAIFRLDPLCAPDAPLQHVATSRCGDLDKGVLFLQCQWHPTAPRVVAVTTSTGLARLLRLNEEWTIESFTDLNIVNSLEAWCVAFAPASSPGQEGHDTVSAAPVSVYCGGDDSTLRWTSCLWDAEASSFGEEEFGACALKGQHGAGVTAILPLQLDAPDGGRVVVTGSYDDHLRVFSIPDLHASDGLRRASLLVDANLGGGVWRLDLVDTSYSSSSRSSKIRILASCMHAGARLVEITGPAKGGSGEWSCRVLARFEEHKSMNYASDIFARPSGWGPGVEVLRAVSASFYDRLLCVWEYADPAPS